MNHQISQTQPASLRTLGRLVELQTAHKRVVLAFLKPCHPPFPAGTQLARRSPHPQSPRAGRTARQPRGRDPHSTRRWTPHPRLTNTHWTAGPKALAPRWGLSPQNQQMFPNAWREEPQELNLEQALPALGSFGVPATDGLTD